MLANMPLKKPLDQEEPARQKSQHRAAEERYRLRVDGQLKRSFDTKEAALAAGQVIKKAYPVVMVVVVDAQTGTTENVSASI
jgi:hypothetical protein